MCEPRQPALNLCLYYTHRENSWENPVFMCCVSSQKVEESNIYQHLLRAGWFPTITLQRNILNFIDEEMILSFLALQVS